MVSVQRNDGDDAARAQADSHARLTGILNAALDCIVTVDGENRIIEFNPAAEKAFGYRAEDVIGRDTSELVIPPAYRAMHNAGMKRHLSTGEAPARSYTAAASLDVSTRTIFAAEPALAEPFMTATVKTVRT